MKRVLALALLVLLSGVARADLSKPSLLVASATMSGPYARTVVFTLPGADGHIGFVLNRPTEARVAELPGPVFAGGPVHADRLFAFVKAPRVPAERAVQVLPGLYFAFRAEDVEQVVERLPSRTRLFAGLVAWEGGELDEELEAGAWHVLDAELELVLEGSIDTLWSRLLDRAQAMTAAHPYRKEHAPARFVRVSGGEGVAPDQLMRNISDELIAALPRIQSDPKRVSGLVETMLLPHFDARRATRIAMGAYWRHASAEQQERLVREFTGLLVRTYSGALAAYSGQKIEFQPLRARPGDTEVTVRSVVRQAGAEPVVIEYDLERSGASWKVYDVRVAGISLVATYRTSFAEHARNHGIDGLIDLLERRSGKFSSALRM